MNHLSKAIWTLTEEHFYLYILAQKYFTVISYKPDIMKLTKLFNIFKKNIIYFIHVELY